MKLLLVLGSVLGLALPASALAAPGRHHETAAHGDVRAVFSYTYRGPAAPYPLFRNETLTIVRNGKVRYSRPVQSVQCGNGCQPGSFYLRSPSVHVVDLAPAGGPDVVLDLSTYGNGCCSLEEVFRYDSARKTYVESEHDFGNGGAELADLSHDGRYEFLSADGRFFCTFTACAGSGMPIEILAFSAGRFSIVTAHYPGLIARDAKKWLAAYQSMARYGWLDSVGLIAAWAADEDALGHEQAVARYLAQQARARHLRNFSPPREWKFISVLQKFLHTTGYLR